MEYSEAFLAIINEQPEIFTPEDKEDIAKVEWSDDPEEFGDQLYDWAEPRQHVHNEALEHMSEANRLKQALKPLLDKANDRGDLEGSNVEIAIAPKDIKSQLQAAIQRNLVS